jgi:hypothetical protein
MPLVVQRIWGHICIQSVSPGRGVRQSCVRELLSSLSLGPLAACSVATRVSSRQRLVPGEHKDRYDHPCGIGEDVDSSRQAERRICTPASTRKGLSRETGLTM